MASLRALECFVAVADTGSITAAARMLYLSQPAVSHQIAVFEQEAGTALIRRDPRGVKLTTAGRAAVADARRAVDAAASSVRSAREAGNSPGGIVRLGSVESLTVALLAPVVGRWHVQFPEVAITLRESSATDDLLDRLDSDEIDIAILPGPVPDRFSSTILAEEEIVLALHFGYPLVEREFITLADINDRPLVQYAPENELGGWITQALARAGIRPEAALCTSVTATAPQLAAAGLGVAISPVGVIASDFPGRVRSFTPQWFRDVVAVTTSHPETLIERFVSDLAERGIQVPESIQSQLTPPGERVKNR